MCGFAVFSRCARTRLSSKSLWWSYCTCASWQLLLWLYSLQSPIYDGATGGQSPWVSLSTLCYVFAFLLPAHYPCTIHVSIQIVVRTSCNLSSSSSSGIMSSRKSSYVTSTFLCVNCTVLQVLQTVLSVHVAIGSLPFFCAFLWGSLH